MLIYEPAGRAREYASRALNIYRGCDHGCVYCYAPAVLRMSPEKFHGCVAPRGDLATIAKEARQLTAAGHTAPILLCFTTDAYCPGARSYPGWTRSVIETIKAAGQHVCVLSKAGTYALADLDLFGPGDEFATTLTLHDASEYEPQAASTRDRINALVRAHAAGIRTWVSFEPVLRPSTTLELIELVSPVIDFAKIGVTNHMGDLTKNTDWSDFGHRAEELCRRLGLAYLLKHDLRAAMK